MSNPKQSVPRRRGHVRPTPTVAASLRDFVARHGEKVAMDHFGVSRIALARAAAGWTLQGSTLFALEDGLARAAEVQP